MTIRRAVLPLDVQCRYAKLPVPVAEYQFHPSRKWRFDWAWPDVSRMALEVEGGAWVGGRHTHPSGFLKDLEKYSEAAILGWRILRVPPKALANGDALALIARALGQD